MIVSKNRARLLGFLAIFSVFIAQAFSSYDCYNHSLSDFIGATVFFVLPPLAPALIAWFSPNPLYSVGSALCFLPWIIYAYRVDCVLPYQGGGASMVYVLVLLYGMPSALFGLVLTKAISSVFGISIESNQNTEQVQ